MIRALQYAVRVYAIILLKQMNYFMKKTNAYRNDKNYVHYNNIVNYCACKQIKCDNNEISFNSNVNDGNLNRHYGT